MSWKPEIFVEGKWSQNGLVFATEAEALASANDTFARWWLADGARAVEVSDEEYPVNYTWKDGKVESVERG